MKSISSLLKNLWLFNQKTIFDKQHINILVTDSGVGGLSVADDLYNYFNNNHHYKSVNVIYSNCRNGKDGYNAIQDVDIKIKMFSDKLFQLDKQLDVDIIFIACNTLSVLLNKTEFYKKCHKPIIDICGVSLNLMSKALNNGNGLFILGTKTTIGENYYKNNLIDVGFDKTNIVNQLCPNLAKHIEQKHIYGDFFLDRNVRWLVNRIKEKKPKHFDKYTISFNCTHYYYALKYFKKYFKEIGEQPQFICPNFELKNIFVDNLKSNNLYKTDVKLFVYKPNISKKHINKLLSFSENKNLIFLV